MEHESSNPYAKKKKNHESSTIHHPGFQERGRFLFASLFNLLSLELSEVLNPAPSPFSESYKSLNDFCTFPKTKNKICLDDLFFYSDT